MKEKKKKKEFQNGSDIQIIPNLTFTVHSNLTFKHKIILFAQKNTFCTQSLIFSRSSSITVSNVYLVLSFLHKQI